jgi:hypothetical protein
LTGTNSDADKGGAAKEEPGLLSMAVQLVTVTAVALPVLGFVTRAVAFALCGRIGVGSMHLAGAVPLGDLTISGVHPLIYAAPAYVAVLLTFVPVSAPSGRRELRLWTSIAVGTVPSLVLAAFVMPLDWALFSVSAVAAVMAWYLWMIRRGSGRARRAWTWPILVGFLILGSLSAALAYTDVPTAYYVIDPSTGVQSGDYLEVGRTNDTVYLLSCTGPPAGVVSVSSSSIQRAEYMSWRSAWASSLVQLVIGQGSGSLGLRTVCP